ncbi:MAG TPA: M23 family metallopeptidase [bacterium]|nr:M23 family metallopeptidase [bacterium]
MGIRDKQPFEYYSGHNGIDFKLAFGTPIKAPAEGNATYYFCNSCGHTIKIDHLNGYQTIFMHLQGEGLFTSSSSPIHVNEGEVIGYVGLSGKTTGPHLHLAVLKDKNNNNSFADDIPDGFIDPFSWWADYIQDPWPNFSWQDVLGAHKGTVSPYLWKEDFSPSTKFTNNAEVQVSYYNRSLELPQNATKSGVTIRLSPLGPVGRTPENLYPVPKTGTVIDIIDTLGKKIYEITAPATITIQLNGVDLANYNADTMAIYHFNAEEQIWEILDSVFDPINKIITAHTSSFSAFSVLAEKYDIQAPRSIAMLSTNPLNGWFVGPTNFTVTTNEVADKIYYKIGGEVEWKEYTGSSVSLEVPGSYAIQTMAVDFEGNYETPQEVYIRYNPNRKPTHTNKALGTSFSIANY